MYRWDKTIECAYVWPPYKHILFWRSYVKELQEDILLKILMQRKFWMQDIGGQLYSRIFMNFVEIMIVVKKMEDLKQKNWPNWQQHFQRNLLWSKV